jgi:hypothetical protein
MTRLRGAFVGVALMMAAVSVAAHHSPVMFDRNVTKTLVGKVVDLVARLRESLAAAGQGSKPWPKSRTGRSPARRSSKAGRRAGKTRRDVA